MSDGEKNWCFYSYMAAGMDHGIEKHAQDQMKLLGIKVYGSIPQTMFDGWEFLIDAKAKLPPYIKFKNDEGKYQ